MPNNEIDAQSRAAANLSVRRDGKGRTWSHIRQAWFAEFPEEVVRQEFACRLVNDYGFALQQMGEEMEVQRGRESAEADIVIWRTAKDKADEKAPLIVVECKSDNVTITAKDYGQGESYARVVNAPFFVTHNNRETRCWRVKKDRMPGYIEEITDIPRAEATDKEIEELIKKLKLFKEDEFADLLHQCHNVIRNREHLDPAAAFDEIAKVLFMKVCFERRLLRGRDRRNRFTADYLDEKADEFKEPIKVLFDQTKDEYEADYLFAQDEEIRLKFPTVREIVRLLERYNLSDTSEDVKGIAFEKFLGKTFRGEIGQFFTPREIVRFMVEMAEPKFGDIICDPASGSGGFLIRFFAKVRDELLAETDAAYAKFKAELEKKKMPEAKRAKVLRDKWQQLQRDLDPKNTASRLWELSNRCVYGTDANDRMARTSKMNMIMHGDGHGGVHHWNGFLNVNGIFDGRFHIILTNPPFGAHVEATALVEVPEGKEWDEAKKRYAGEYGQAYRDTVARVEAETKYAAAVARETKRLEDAIDAAKTAGDKDARKECDKELSDYERATAVKIAAEGRALIKQRFNYPVFLYEAEHVGITATGEPDVNELYPNDRQPAGGAKTCVEIYREFRKNPEGFFADGPAE
jgi:type I restriction enzyme M protein